MATPIRRLQTNHYYHVFNRGVEKRPIFDDVTDYRRFTRALAYYQQSEPGVRLAYSDFDIAERAEPLRFLIVAYALMPNHFHLVLKQLEDQGITRGLSQLATSYSKFYNTRYERVGPLFQGRFKAVEIESDQQLVHVVRYTFINPYVAGLTEDWATYPWIGYRDYERAHPLICDPEPMRAYFSNQASFRAFIDDQKEYGRSLELAKHLGINV